MHWNFKKEAPYFVLDPEGDGIVYFETAEARDTYAAECIQGYLDSDGWSESVEHVIAGVITHRATQTDRKDKPNDLDDEGCDGEGEYWGQDCDYTCNYKILPIDA